MHTQASGPLPPSSALLESGYVLRPDSSSILRTPINNAKSASWANNAMPTISLPHTTKGTLNLNYVLSEEVKYAPLTLLLAKITWAK